jgi:excinuclease ABC subunit C
MTKSVLDEVPGLGPTRRRRLLKEFGSVKRLREQPLEMLLELSWLPDNVARTLYDQLHGGPALGEGNGPAASRGLPSLDP